MATDLSHHVRNLPAAVTTFVGRKSELADARRLISAHRLITLTGVGGVGKTRLALQVADRLRGDFPDGTALVELADARDPQLLVHIVADTVGMRDLPDHDPDAALCRYIGDKRMLLILDSCEYLLDACGVLCGRLLQECPNLRILATSREPLGIGTEKTWAIGPLSVPETKGAVTPRDLGRYEAVSLFADRAKASVPGFEITEDNAQTVAALCRQLEGLPLAIELAVVLLRSLPPKQLLYRLSHRYALPARQRGEPVRQRTLWDSIEWSYELCSDEEQLLWRRLSVFAGGFDLDAAEGVCGGRGLDVGAVSLRLRGLVDKSVMTTDRESRFHMLESIREFGLTKLRDSGEETPLRDRHQAWYERVLLRADSEWVSPWQEYWLVRLNAEHANIRTALRHCLTQPRLADSALRMAVFPWRFYWWSPGRFCEGRTWLDEAIAHATEKNALYAHAVLQSSKLAVVHGDLERGKSLLDEGRSVAERLDDPATTARAEHASGHLALWSDHDLAGALVHYERALTALSAQPDLNQRVETLLAMVICSALIPDEQRAAAYHQELLTIIEPAGELRYKPLSLFGLGLGAWRCGDLRRATSLQQESLRLKLGFRDLLGIAFSLQALVCIAATEQQPRRAATLHGAAEKLLKATGTSVAFQPLSQHYAESVQSCRAALGERQFDTALERGLSLTSEEAVAYALGEGPRAAPARSATDHPTLTRREREVADLLTRGLTNRQIAESLVISPRTAESHVENILVKLGLTSREQVITRVSEHGDHQGGPPRAPEGSLPRPRPTES